MDRASFGLLSRQECCRNCNYVRHELVLVQATATQDFSEILLPDGKFITYVSRSAL
jgi:hypothetical protein